MSKTKRKILSLPSVTDYYGNLFIDIVDDTKAKHRKVRFENGKKLKPYIKSSLNLKEVPFDVRNGKARNNTGFSTKVNRDRINRSYKKGLRQSFKNDIKKELETCQ